MRKRGSKATISRQVCVPSISILRSGVRRKSHAPFWNSGRRSDPPIDCNRDERRDYGEGRYRALGRIGDRLYAVVFTIRPDEFHVISFRRANRREEALYVRNTEPGRGTG